MGITVSLQAHSGMGSTYKNFNDSTIACKSSKRRNPPYCSHHGTGINSLSISSQEISFPRLP